jgi:hypothetical protein
MDKEMDEFEYVHGQQKVELFWNLDKIGFRSLSA